MSFTLEQLLHDRVTRGEQLTVAEQRQLDAWYTDLERQESQALFGQPVPPTLAFLDPTKMEQLQQQIDDLLQQLSATTVRLQEVTDDNKRLRREITVLRTKVAEHIALEAA